mmetsp:Transcript_17730/g.53835  ORF Transcript_17730/g.53835 Transcript_17730/m.53835 type:complete len:369 (+) Transcript_17730:919-2025(+)
MTFQSRRSFSGSGRNSTKLPTGGTSRSCRSSAVDWGASVGSRGGSTKSRGRRTISSTSRSSSGAPGPWPWPPGAASGRALPEPAAAALLSSSTQALQDLRSATLAARMASFRRPMRRSARTRARHLAPARTKRSITCKRTEKVSLEFSSQCGVAMGLKLLGTATWLWLSTDSTRATSSRMWLSRRRACLLLRASCTFWMASSVSGSSPVARSLRSSFSRSCFSISRKSISKRSSRACRCSSPAPSLLSSCGRGACSDSLSVGASRPCCSPAGSLPLAALPGPPRRRCMLRKASVSAMRRRRSTEARPTGAARRKGSRHAQASCCSLGSWCTARATRFAAKKASEPLTLFTPTAATSVSSPPLPPTSAM